ncbi:hypothetical protein BG004_005605 [Podila humilis]|nr:hypothetical protein BG004_005605 [Podila humilis]
MTTANANSESAQSIRRSTRVKVSAAPSQKPTLVKAKTRPAKAAAPKQVKSVVESSDEECVLASTKTQGSRKAANKKSQTAAEVGSDADQEQETAEEVEDDVEDHEKEGDEHESSFEDEEEEEEDSESDFEEPASKARKSTATLRKRRASKEDRIPIIQQKKSSSGAKSTRTPKTTKGPKYSGLPGSSKKNTVAKRTDAMAGDEEEVEQEVEKSEFYSAVLDSQVALEPLIDDWTLTYEESSSVAMLKLVNFLIRCCGCKEFISLEDFDYEENNNRALENILQEYRANTVNFDYPIVSKDKEYKKFKKNLVEFYSHLLQKARGDMLFDGVFMETLLPWTIALSGTSFRPVRHTATTAALNIMSSLAEFSSETQNELDTTIRQLATSQKQKALPAKIKQLQKKVTGGKRRMESLMTWINDIFESVFVPRCRDVDPLVRADCIQELGRWMEENQDEFITPTYLPYLGWALSDRVAAVRLESMKVLGKLYEIDNQPNGLRQFTARFTPRFIEMAVGEPDIATRLAAIRVVTLVQKHGQLEQEDQIKMSALIYGSNARVRKSLAKFVKTRIWEDEVENRLATCDLLANSVEEEMPEVRREWVELKSLVSFLIKVGKADANKSERADPRLIDETKVGRVSLAVEALWSEIESLKNWQSMAEYLALDHTVAPSSSSKSEPKSLEDCYHLEEEEENVLLEIFIAALQITVTPPNVPGFVKDKAKLRIQHDDLVNEVGRFCVNALPRLFLKYSVDPIRIRSVLVIPQLMPLNVYVDMRMNTAFEEMVDEVIKVYKKHTDTSVLQTAAITVRTIQSCEIMRVSHESKIDALSAYIIDIFLNTASNIVIDTWKEKQDMSITTTENVADNDSLHELKLALLRLEHLIKATDVATRYNLSSEQEPYDALIKVIEQNKNVSGDNAEILVSALSIAFLWISWVCRDNSAKYGQDADWTENDATEVEHMQESLLRITNLLAIKEGSNVNVRARRKAFQVLGDAYWLFGGDMFHSSKGIHRHRLFLACPEETQKKCEDFVRSEIELWGEKVREKLQTLETARKETALDDLSQQNGNMEDGDNEVNIAEEEISEIVSNEYLAASQVEQEDKHEMFGTVFSFMRQIILGDFDMGHATAVIAHYGRFGAEFDEGVKRVVDGIKGQAAQSPSFENFVQGHVRTTDQVLHLAKLLTSIIRPTGFLRKIRASIDLKLVLNLQKQGIVYGIEQIQKYHDTEDKKKQTKAAKFFDVLGQMLLGIQIDRSEIIALGDLIETESANRGLTLDVTEKMYEPIRLYQSKLEKLVVKVVAEQAVAEKKRAEAAATAEGEAAEVAQDQRDVDMDPAQDADAAVVGTKAGNVNDEDPSSKPADVVTGKKRQANSEDHEDETEEPEGSGGVAVRNVARHHFADSGHESDSGTNPKEAKRVRID